MKNQDFTQHDVDLLDKVEQIVAGKAARSSGDGAVTVTDATTLYGFCAHLAHTTPQADASFRRELLARIAGALPPEQPAEFTEASAHQAPALNGSAPHGVDSKKPLHAGKLAKLVGSSRVLLNNGHVLKRGRVGSAAAALAGLAIMLALFTSMAFMLKVRKELNQPQGTPTVTGANNIEPARGIVPLQTVDVARVQYMAWSPNGGILATGYSNNVELWAGSGPTGKPLQRLKVYSVSGLEWSPDEKMIAVGETPNSIRLFDVASGQELHPTPSNMPMTPNADAAWSPDGLLIASSFRQSPSPNSTPGIPSIPGFPLPPMLRTPFPGENDGPIRLWDPAGGNTVRVLRMPAAQSSNPMMASKMVWSPKGRYLAVLYGNGSTAIWDYTVTGPKVILPSIVGKGARYSDASRDIEWSLDGRTLARLAGDVVELWDADTGKMVRFMPDPPPPPIVPPPPPPTAVAPLHTPQPAQMPAPVPTNEQGFTVTPLPQLPYASPTAVPTYVYKDQEYGLVSGLAWSPDGGTLATFDGSNIRLWDPATGLQKRRLVSGAAIRKIAWSNDGDVLFTLEGEPSTSTPPDMLPVTSDRYHYLDGTLKLWNPAMGQQIYATSQRGLSDFELSPDGRTVAVRVGAAVSLWSIDNGATPIATRAATTAAALPTATPRTAGDPTAVPLCGTWSIVPSPDKGKVNYLRSVAATSENDIWAVGFHSTSPVYGWEGDAYTGAGTAQTLIEHWDGKQWRIVPVPSPNASTGSSYLFGVAAASPNNVWAVGYSTASSGVQQSLVLNWDGQTWKIVPSPDPGNNTRLMAVTAIATDDVWAVGSYGEWDDPNTGPSYTLTLHWDGKSWQQILSPSPGSDSNHLLAVSALLKDDVWAVGFDNNQQERGMHGLAMHWDGTRWRVAATPGLGPVLNGVVAVFGENVWTTGGWTEIGGGSWVAKQLDLGGKAVDGSPDLTQQGTEDSYLGGIAAPSANDIWAVGAIANRKDEGGPELEAHKPLVQHWDGKAWGTVPSPAIDPQESGLSAVTTVSSNIWAVGYHGNSTLIMRFVRSTGLPCVTPVSIATTATTVPRSTYTPAGSATSLPITNTPTVNQKATATLLPSALHCASCGPPLLATTYKEVAEGDSISLLTYYQGIAAKLSRTKPVQKCYTQTDKRR